MKTIEFTENEIEDLKKLVTGFNLFYENETEWSFNDLDTQREIAVEIVKILEDKI
jgi:hypothetical protein